ncbi:TetR/AcrR family transcriptional regulator [Lacticaseibacillus saniviri]|uniref:HTH tetR-type domain-containing protein n=2 Tax=Lacticaseibacillus saniviri TaxID=931533 RepID=A0A0R2N3C8_9LACO|nr:TetR/AcrR family transcriptional regulator [Lacticaseibacillus saniviri]KRO18896.1 hypothetical protein IV56_GL000048 [Lacticaseibacillus saniviri JCM 17471 = DSM 24301]MCG4280914.1 TetR/AcrR family transcriptional regulator [Lacticaseibacillus saniviri]
MTNTSTNHNYHHGNLRAELLRVAEENLRADKLDALSLRELARQLGVSHAAPSRHFKDRQALLDALAEDGFNRLATAIQEALQPQKVDFQTELLQAVMAFATFATENAALFSLMNTGKHQSNQSAINVASEHAFAPILGLIIAGQAQGRISAGNPRDIGLILFATILGITTMVNGQMIAANQLTPLVTTAVEQFLRSMQ